MDRIMTWDTHFEDSPLTRHIRLWRDARRRGVDIGKEAVVDTSMTFRAFVNAGRWIVKCPWCHGAEFAREDGLHICQSCWNSGARRKYVKTVFPQGRAEIEAILVKRLDPVNRNWQPGETLEFLQHENAENGVT